jgi:hypothetical protein
MLRIARSAVPTIVSTALLGVVGTLLSLRAELLYKTRLAHPMASGHAFSFSRHVAPELSK